MPRTSSREATVGAFLALALIVLAVGIMAVGGESRLFSQKASYRVVFPSTDGLIVGSPVKMGGVQVGSVTQLKLPTDPGAQGVEVSIGVQRSYASRVRQGSEASQRFLQYLSGEKFVELTPGDPHQPAIPEGELVPSSKGSRLFEQSEDIADNLNAITVSLKEILEPLQNGRGLLGEIIQDPEFGKEGMAKIEATVDNIRDITQRIKEGRGAVGKFVSDDALAARIDDLGNAVKDLSAIMAAIRRGEGAIGSLTMEGGDAQVAIADFRESAASLRRVTARLESSDGLIGKLVNDTAYSNEVAEHIRAAAANLSAITKKINEGKGSLGLLVNERTLYDGAEEVFAGVNDSKFASWMLRHYQKKGIEAPSPSPSPSPKP
jgi:phospholipid/cholesterol/gamma-HCH transport system substrate-binding protein